MDEKIRTTFRLPRWLHKAIKQEALDIDHDMQEIIIEQLSARYPEQAALFFGSRKEVILPKSELEDTHLITV